MQKITADSPEAKSADIVAENIARLKELFPEAFAEDGIDFEVLKQLLGGVVNEKEEKYSFTWPGKRQARQIALTPSLGTLRPTPGESVDWDSTKNIFIEGDNLEVLKLLQKSYSGKVKMIYIDPPYNTGKDFVYNDDYIDNIKSYLELINDIGVDGTKYTDNPKSSGRYHTNWLNMMLPRLHIAKKLLSNNGALFISIDDNELSNLKKLCDEVYGEDNFIAYIPVVTNMKGRNDKKHIAACHEYVIIYGNNDFDSNGLPLSDEQRAAYKYTDQNGSQYALRDLRKRGGPDKREDRPNMYFPIYINPETNTCALDRLTEKDIEVYPLRGDGSEGRWRWGKDKVALYLTWLHPKFSARTDKIGVEHRVYLDAKITLDPQNSFSDEEDDSDDEDFVERTTKPKSIWFGGEFSTDCGKRALKEFLPGECFDFPKSVFLLKQCIRLSSGVGDIILDMFAGSCTLAQASFELALEDTISRRCISIQLPEQLDITKKEQKGAALFCKSHHMPLKMSELGKERIRRVIKKIKAEHPDYTGDLGFRVFKLDSSNIRPWNPDANDVAGSLLAYTDNLLPDRTEEDLLYEILLKFGLDLTTPVQEKNFGRHTVRALGQGVLFACLSPKIATVDVEAIGLGITNWRLEANPVGESTVIFRDSAFEGDIAKANMTAILQQYGINNVRSL